MRLHPDVQAFLEALRALQHFLEPFDDQWAASVQRAADQVASSDAHGLARFIGLFGGMGSLNDLVLQDDGQPLGWENVQLAAFTGKAWTVAQYLKRDTG